MRPQLETCSSLTLPSCEQENGHQFQATRSGCMEYFGHPDEMEGMACAMAAPGWRIRLAAQILQTARFAGADHRAS